MATILIRNLGPARGLVAGEWSIETMSGRPAVCCPDCGEIRELEQHEIPKKPSTKTPYVWDCPTQGCAFRNWLFLDALYEPVAR